MLDETDETFRLLLSEPVNAFILDKEAVGTIADNDPSPSLSVNNVAVTEGGADVTATFNVTLSAPSERTVAVDYRTAAGAAKPGEDYTTVSLKTLVFAPGETIKTVSVTVKGDALDESAETFQLALSSPRNATIATVAGACTITDDDPTPSIAIGDNAVTEFDSTTSEAAFTVTLSAPSGQTVTVKYMTADGTAKAPADYAALALTTLTFKPGETSKTILVRVKGDSVKESNETFFVNLSGAVHATVSDAQGVGAILDND